MTSFPILDLVVGIVFYYFILSIISSSFVEMLLTVMKVRARVLEQWFKSIFDTKMPGKQTTLGHELIDHCAVTALSPKGKSPSYIHATNFVTSLLEQLSKNLPENTIKNAYDNVPQTLDDIQTTIEGTTLLSSEMKRLFLLYISDVKNTIETAPQTVKGHIELLREKMEAWYDSNMDRLVGVMKERYTRKMTFWIAIVAVLVMNADSIEIAKYLYTNPTVRAKVASQAYTAAEDSTFKAIVTHIRTAPTDTASTVSLDKLKSTITERVADINAAKNAINTELPLGWTGFNSQKMNVAEYVAMKLIGLTITVLALMMGAPFWFDLLNKLANVRGNGPKPGSLTDVDRKAKGNIKG